MSSGPRMLLGVACLVIAIGFAAVGALYGTIMLKGPLPMYAAGVFSALVSLACFSPQSRPVALRFISITVFIVCCGYVYSSWGQPNIANALRAFIVFGLPSGFVTLWGFYPAWGRSAAAFGSERPGQ
jgi:hypothetical protein